MRPRPTAEEIGPAHSGCEHERATARWHPVSMKELTMPIRFSTQAANADFLRDDAETTGASEGMPQGVGANGSAARSKRARPSPARTSTPASSKTRTQASLSHLRRLRFARLNASPPPPPPPSRSRAHPAGRAAACGDSTSSLAVFSPISLRAGTDEVGWSPCLARVGLVSRREAMSAWRSVAPRLGMPSRRQCQTKPRENCKAPSRSNLDDDDDDSVHRRAVSWRHPWLPRPSRAIRCVPANARARGRNLKPRWTTTRRIRRPGPNGWPTLASRRRWRAWAHPAASGSVRAPRTRRRWCPRP